MKKTTLRMTVISACVGAGLALSACGGGGSAEGGDTGEDTAASEEAGAEESGGEDAGAAEAATYTEEDLTAAVEAGGFEPQTQSAEESPEIAGSMADMEVEPAECKVFMSAAAAAVDDTDATIVIGAPSDGSTTIGGALGYADESAAADMLSSSTGMLDTCSDMSISAEGMEMTASTSEVDASVDGADQVVATEMAMDVSGQEMTTTTIQAQNGSAIISVASSSGAGMEAASVEDMSATAAEMIAALP